MQSLATAVCSKKKLILILLIVVVMPAIPAQAQRRQNAGPWYVGFDLGYGRLLLGSDQQPGHRRGTEAMAFRGGRNLGRHFRIGVELNGWLLQAYDIWDPAEGESVSNFLCIGQILPIACIPAYLQLGGGMATYTNMHPDEFGSEGWCWTVGMGYLFQLSTRLSLAPVVSYTAGDLRDIIIPGTVKITSRGYSVWDVRLSLVAHPGKHLASRK